MTVPASRALNDRSETEPVASPARAETLGEQVFARLLDMILNCEIAPGAVLNEQALATRLNVSRGPVREAVRRLQGIQLVTREAQMRARVISLDAGAIVDLFHMREALEGYACRLAAERITEAELSSIEQQLEATRRASLEPAARPAGTAFDFHTLIVQASGNARIIDALCGDLYLLLKLYRKWSGTVTERKSAAYDEHWQILRAMRARDPDLAESLMRSHVRRAREHIIQTMPTPAPNTPALRPVP